MHASFVFLASIQHREQVQHLFLVDLPEVTEQKVCFSSVIPPSIPKKMTKKSAVKKTVSIVQKREKEEIQNSEDDSSKKEKTVNQEVSKSSTDKTNSDEKIIKKADPVGQKFSEKDLVSAKERNQLRRLQQKNREKFLAVSSALKKEIGMHWHPPICEQEGLEVKACCTLSPRGYLEQLSIIESSSVMAYDASVVRSLKKMSFVKELWGKRFLILFRK